MSGTEFQGSTGNFQGRRKSGKRTYDQKMQSKGPRKQMKIKHSLTQILSPFDECYKKKNHKLNKDNFPKRYVFEAQKKKNRTSDQDSEG